MILVTILIGAGCRAGQGTATTEKSVPRISREVAPLPARSSRIEFTRLIAHWSGYGEPGYLQFVDEVKPEIAQVGFYGAHFWSLADTPFGRGYPAHLPVRGHEAGGEWFARLNEELHRRGAKVVGHFNLKFLVGDPEGPEGPRGFFRFYREQWDERLLGPKPVADPLELLEKDKLGNPISNKNYGIGGMREYWACLNNPHWRQVLKAWVRCGIARGVDGYISNYFYRHDCHCQYCVAGFRRYLDERFSRAELKTEFAITNLSVHVFDEIVAWHDPAQSTPLRREMLRFSQIANQGAFDEVFLEFGRSLKPDLIVAQWNHLGDFSQISGDERCFLPRARWGRGEDYLWYSTGDLANRTDLAAGNLGEGTLQARYIRGAFQDKPFTLGKYESVRIRAAIAELAANGGAPMGFYASFEDPLARQELVRYYSFLRRYEALYHSNRSAAEIVLLFPRTRVHAGDLGPLHRFKQLGRRLLDTHRLFDVVPDDSLSPLARSQYRAVLDCSDPADTSEGLTNRLPTNLSRFGLPPTVRVSASRPARGKELTLHFVNYNREEPADPRNSAGGIKNEKPIPAPAGAADLKWDHEWTVERVEFLTPEQEHGKELEFRQLGGRLHFRIPEFLVYGVTRIHTRDAIRKR